MLEQSLLSDRFQSLLDAERHALKTYSDIVGKVSDAEMAAKLQQLLREKQRHVELAQRLLEIVN